jgi:hypothetical protein
MYRGVSFDIIDARSSDILSTSGIEAIGIGAGITCFCCTVCIADHNLLSTLNAHK